MRNRVGGGNTDRVDGAFYVSTADSLRFEDGSSLLLTDGSDINVSIASPAAFGFNNNGGEIRFDGASIRTSGNPVDSDFDAINLFAGNLHAMKAQWSAT